MENPMTIEEKIKYIKSGGKLCMFSPDEIREIQEKALDSKDIRLYDYLDKYWNRT